MVRSRLRLFGIARLRGALLIGLLAVGLAIGGPWAMAATAVTDGADPPAAHAHHDGHHGMHHAAPEHGAAAQPDTAIDPAPFSCADSSDACCALCASQVVGFAPSPAGLSGAIDYHPRAISALSGVPRAPAPEPPKHHA